MTRITSTEQGRIRLTEHPRNTRGNAILEHRRSYVENAKSGNRISGHCCSKLDTEINGVQVWWDEDFENSGEYDFGISVCDAHLSPPVYNAKPVCICPE